MMRLVARHVVIWWDLPSGERHSGLLPGDGQGWPDGCKLDRGLIKQGCYRKLIRVIWWACGWVLGSWLERTVKLTFITGFLSTIFIGLQQAPNIETLTIEKLFAKARVLMTNGAQGQDLISAMGPPWSNVVVPVRSSPSISVTCYQYCGKSHMLKDCEKCEMQCC